jgi:hypothetical protein
MYRVSKNEFTIAFVDRMKYAILNNASVGRDLFIIYSQNGHKSDTHVSGYNTQLSSIQ